MNRKKKFQAREEIARDLLFIHFLEDLAKNEKLGGDKIIRHSRSVLKLFLREIPEKLSHSKRYSSQSTTSGSISGIFSPSYKTISRSNAFFAEYDEHEHRNRHHRYLLEVKEGEDLPEENEGEEGERMKDLSSMCLNERMRSSASGFLSSSLQSSRSSHYFYPSSSSGRMSSGGSYLGKCLIWNDLKLAHFVNSSLESNSESNGLSGKFGDESNEKEQLSEVTTRGSDGLKTEQSATMSASTTSGSSSRSGSACNSPSAYRIATNDTSAFLTRTEAGLSDRNSNQVAANLVDCGKSEKELGDKSNLRMINEGIEKLNIALREERIKRISTNTNKMWPSSVSSYLHGIDLFLKIPKYLRPVKKEGQILNLSIGSFFHPHPSKIHYGGEDAHFFEENVIGVADGVGEWVNYGLNPRAFANELILGIKNAFLDIKGYTSVNTSDKETRLIRNVSTRSERSQIRSRNREEVESETGSDNMCKLKQVSNKNSKSSPAFFGKHDDLLTDSQYLLNEGYKNTKSFGSSTVLVACFDPRLSVLRISYLGDSGIIILRRIPETFRMGIVYRSPAQQHSFNCPYQLSKLPTKDDYQSLQEKGLNYFINLVKSGENTPQDLPSHSISKEIPVLQSDLIIIATDGLFDNLYDYEICNICSGAISPYESIRLLKDLSLFTSSYRISKALANAAYLKSIDPKAKTPFNRQSIINNEPWQFNFGGKLDDITVVSAWVVSVEDQGILSSFVDSVNENNIGVSTINGTV